MTELICKVNGCEIKNKNEELKKENEWLKQKLQETECSPNCQWQKENEQLKWEQKQILEDNESYQKENEELKAQIEKMKQSCIDVMKVQANSLSDDYMAGMYNGMVVIYNSCFLDEKNELEKDFCSNNNGKWETDL